MSRYVWILNRWVQGIGWARSQVLYTEQEALREVIRGLRENGAVWLRRDT